MTIRIRALLFLGTIGSLVAGVSMRSMAAEPRFDGTWQAESTPPGATWTAVLRVQGEKLTGAVSTCASWSPVEIYETRIDGDRVEFKCKTGRTVIAFTGTLRGDELSLTWNLHQPPYGWDMKLRLDGPAPAQLTARLFGPSAPQQLAARRVAGASGPLTELAAKAAWIPARPAAVPFDRILHADDEPQNWLTYSGTLLGQRYSALTQVTPENVARLELTWVWQAQSEEKFEATPLVVDGILFTVEPPDTVVALDAATGVVLWKRAHTPPPETQTCCGGVNRGVAILGDQLFLGTLDAHLQAIQAQTGNLIWDTTVTQALDPLCKGACYSITHAPLIVKDKVIVGVAGGDTQPGYGIRGFIAAFDARTGKEVWRFSTIPGPGEPGHETWAGDSWKTGGAAVWNTGTYDRDLNLTYWGTGNPSPNFSAAKERLGDNLYSDSVIALDADTGKLKWHYQFTPHDDMDWDSAEVPLLTDIEWQGRLRKVILFANRNGLVYVLDRATGQFLGAKPYVDVNWTGGFDKSGRPIRLPRQEGVPTQPAIGGTNWYPSSYSPHTGLYYIPASIPVDARTPYDSALLAFDPKTIQKKWEFRMQEGAHRPQGSPWQCATGALSTASDLVFTGGQGRYFYALGARTGQMLWRMSLATGPVQTGAIAYSVAGQEFIAVPAGNTLFAFSLPH